jgi:hypothetical protein
MNVYTYICACVYACMYTYIYIYICIHINICIFVCIHQIYYRYLYIHTRIHIYIYIFTYTMIGGDISQLLIDSKSNRKIKEIKHYCHTLLVHSSSLQLLALERHGHLFSIDVSTAKKADSTMRTFYQKATESNRFLIWLKSYMRVDVDDTLAGAVSHEVLFFFFFFFFFFINSAGAVSQGIIYF